MAAQSLTPTLAARVGRLVPLLGSDKPGEVVAAAAIGRTLTAGGADFHALAEHVAAPRSAAPLLPPGDVPIAPELAGWVQIIDRCLRAAENVYLPRRDLEFLEGVRVQIVMRRKPPSPKQTAWLAGLAERLGAV